MYKAILILISMHLSLSSNASSPQEIKKWAKYYEYARPFLVQAIVKKESNFNPLSFNPEKSGSYGLMQIQCDLAKDQRLESPLKYSCDQLFDGKINVRFGIQYLKFIEKTLIDLNIENIIAAYNAGFDKNSATCDKRSKKNKKCLQWKMNPRRCKHYNVFKYEGFKPMRCYPGEYINEEYVWHVKRHYKYLKNK